MSTTASPTDDASPRQRPSSSDDHREIDETVLPAESENTAYSIDLDALLGGSKDDDGGDLTLDDTEPFDTVRSEDVDGPSDFTQNMEFWMRTRLPIERQQQQQKKKRKMSPAANATAAQTGMDESSLLPKQPPPPPQPVRPSAAPGSFDSRDHVSDSEGEDDDHDNGRDHHAEDDHEDAVGSEHGSYEYGQSEQGEDTREVAAAAMQDLHGYVISDEDTFMPPGSRRGSSTIGDDDRSSQQGSIDEQIDILSSMDDVNEEEYRSVSASPAPRQEDWRRQDAPGRPRASWLQPTVEDHEDTPPPPSNRPSPGSGGGARAPGVRIEDYEDHLRKNEEARRRAGLATQDSAATSRAASSFKSGSDEDTEDLRAQINRLRNELERQREDFTSQIAGLEKQLHRTRSERDEARENEQRRVRDLNAQHNDRAKDLEDHWQRRLAMAQERYEQDVQEQKAAFTLVKSSFESRLSATESGLQAQLTQRDAEMDAMKSAHRQELEQQRAGYNAKVASLEDRIRGLQAALANADRGDSDQQSPGEKKDNSSSAALEQQKAEADARIAELEARLAATQAHLETARASSLSSSFHSDSAARGADELLERSRRQVEDLERNMGLLQEQLALARRETDGLRQDADAARDSARVLRDELRAAHGRVADGARRVEVLERARDEEEETAEAARRDVARMLENARKEADEERKRAREMERAVERVRSEKEDVRRKAEQAVRVAGTRLNGERIEKAGLRRALDELRAEVEVLRGAVEGRKKDISTSPNDDQPPHGVNYNQHDGNRVGADEHTTETFSSPDSRSSELEALRRALRDADAAAKAAREEARSAKEAAAAMKEDFASVNRAMDERVTQMMRAREKEWRRKVDTLEKEKKALGRALLHEWGREEVGEGEPQGYRYKFVSRKGGAAGVGENGEKGERKKGKA